MNILKISCLASLIWLTGCASTGVINSSTASAAGSESAAMTSKMSAAEARYPLLSKDALLPITATRAGSKGGAQLLPPTD